MKNILLIAALMAGVGFTAAGAEAAVIGGNFATAIVKHGSAVEQAGWRGYRYHNRWWKHRRWRHGHWDYY